MHILLILQIIRIQTTRETFRRTYDRFKNPLDSERVSWVEKIRGK